MKFGEKVRLIREARQLTQEELAERLHLTQGQIAKIEAGTRSVPVDDVDRFADALDVETTTFHEPAVWSKAEAAKSRYETEMQEVYAIFRHGAQRSGTTRALRSDPEANAARGDEAGRLQRSGRTGRVLAGAGIS